MEINEWRPMAHWNESFGLELNDDEVEVLDTFLAAIAEDDRFSEVSGFASVRRSGAKLHIYSPELVRLVLRSIKSIPDDVGAFLRAAKELHAFPRPVREFDYVEDEEYTSRRMKLSSKQAGYARGVHDALKYQFGYAVVYTKEDDRLCDPSLMKAASSIARRRYPRNAKGRAPRH